MEGVHSFEKRSVADGDKSKTNRVIIANRRQPNVYWSTANQSIKSDGSRWSLKTLLCCFCTLFSKSRASFKEFRKQRLHRVDSLVSLSLIDEFLIDTGPFPSNEWLTSKYTMWNFLPKNLFEQFRRVANFYFLITGTMQLVLPFSPVGPATSLTPLLFVVSTTAIKQAYEDYLRHKLDREVNNRICYILKDKKLVSTRSKDIHVGDIVYVKNNEEIPCDMILLATSGSGDRCYVTTANLDGETSLKSRTCFIVRSLIGSIEEIDKTLLVVECEQPNATLYEFNGVLRAPKDGRDYDRLIDLIEPGGGGGGGAQNGFKQNQEFRQQPQRHKHHFARDGANSEQMDNVGNYSTNHQTLEGEDSHLVVQKIYRQIRKTNLQLTQRNTKPSHPKKSTDRKGSSHRHTTEQLVEKSSEYTEISLDISNLLLRASRLRNTSYIYGLAVHTGTDTKLAHNSQVKPNKFSSTESRVNLFLLLAFFLLITLTVSSAVHKTWYSHPETVTTRAIGDPKHAPKTFLDNLLAHFLLYNYIVPISLYVTLEFIKFFGTIAVIKDKRLRVSVWKSLSTVGNETIQQVSYATTLQTQATKTEQIAKTSNGKTLVDVKKNSESIGQPELAKNSNSKLVSRDQKTSEQMKRISRVKVIEKPQCNSSDLNEDLGQVEVLVTDKTGTLTENKMCFMACSIYGQLYRCVSNHLYQQPAGWCQMLVPNLVEKLATIQTNRYASIGPTSANSSNRSNQFGSKIYNSRPTNSRSQSQSGGSISSGATTNGIGCATKLNARERPFDHRFVPPLSELKLASGALEQYQSVVEFFICLCLCSTITLNETKPLADCLPDKTLLDFQSASPDEESLISAGALFGISMCKSNERECFIAIKRTGVPGNSTLNASTISSSRNQLTIGKTKTTTTLGSRVNQPQGQWTKPRPLGRSNASGSTRGGGQAQKAPKKGHFIPLVETNNSTDKYIVRHFERLVAFEFNSTRKRMSVIYRDCDNDCKLIVTKGSESVLDCIRMKQLSAQNELCINLTLAHFEAFAKSGLRTMLVAKRLVSNREYERITNDLKLVRLAGTNREQLIENLYCRVESDLSFVGTTAVEDSLQDGVPETIADLKEAGIRVWLLTGDKVETAVSVAYLCKLLDRNMSLLYLVRQRDSKACKESLEAMVLDLIEIDKLRVANESKWSSAKANVGHDEQLPDPEHQAIRGSLRPKSPGRKMLPNKNGKNQQISNQEQHKPATIATAKLDANPTANGQHNGQHLVSKMPFSTDCTGQQPAQHFDLSNRFALIVDGRSLHYAMKYAREELETICGFCICVLGCRLSPLQKAEVVGMIKSGVDEPVTAAIGDGANDVSMIQEAHVGIGINGKEGRQAVNSSDFAIKRFHMLSRLFFVHGHQFYYRTANTILYFFYKNILFMIPQFIYSFYNQAPARSIYQPVMLVTYNLFFTSIPILLYGLLECHISEPQLEQQPQLYRLNKQNHQMRLSAFMVWSLLAIIQGSIAYYWLIFIWEHNTKVFPGEENLLIGLSTALYFVIVIAATFKLYLLAKFRNLYFNLASLITVVLLPIFFYIISITDMTVIFGIDAYYSKFQPLVMSPVFWLGVTSASVALIVPDVLFTFLF